MTPGGPPWIMFASVQHEGTEREKMAFFGPIGYARQDTLATRVVKVSLDPTDEPTEDDYWAWLDEGSWQPSCIHATEQEMTAQFLLGQPGAPGPREEEKVGLGRILRLRVTVLPEEVHLRRTTRHVWRISSAL